MSSIVPDWLWGTFSSIGLYLVVFSLGYYVFQYVKSQPEPDPSNPHWKSRLIRFFFYGPPEEPVDTENAKVKEAKVELSFGMRALQLCFCAGGLLLSYLSWGLLQERIMTTSYPGGKFTSSNYLIFCNRVAGLLVALAVTRSQTSLPRLRAPFYKFSFTSLSNVLSSFCQLEALKYLSFPSQVLGKSSKLIPVMLMGKVVSGKKYPWYEYAVAVGVITGVTTFVFSDTEKPKDEEKVTSFAGLLFMTLYLTFDSFTSQWQGHLFSQYKMSSYQMMLGVNSFSASFSFLSLLMSGELFTGSSFLANNPEALMHCIGYAICGSTGSMFIFYTIQQFGPLVFTMIMTTRQLIAIVLSSVFYGHKIEAGGILGAAIVFTSISANIYMKERTKREKAAAALKSKPHIATQSPKNAEETVPLKSDVN